MSVAYSSSSTYLQPEYSMITAIQRINDVGSQSRWYFLPARSRKLISKMLKFEKPVPVEGEEPMEDPEICLLRKGNTEDYLSVSLTSERFLVVRLLTDDEDEPVKVTTYNSSQKYLELSI